MRGARQVFRRAFTLVELLVVMAVIATLAALVMPMLARSVWHARSADCSNNLRQCHQGLLLYMAEFSFVAAAGDGAWKRWHNHVETYVHNPAIFRCPMKRTPTVSYGVNYRYHMGPNFAGMVWPYPYLWYNVLVIETIRRPAGTVYLCDVGFMVNKTAPVGDWEEDRSRVPRGFVRFPQIEAPYGSPAEGGATSYPWWVNDPWYPAARHPAGKVNCDFFDGHVESIATERLVNYNYGDSGCLYDNR